MHFLLTLVAAVAVFYVAFALLVFFRQSAYMYVPDRIVDATPALLHMAYEEVRLSTRDGETLAGWFVPAFDTEHIAPGEDHIAGRTVLICHGNAGDIADRLELIRVFHSWRMNVFVFDYRGYGNSTGRPNEQGTYIDATTAWDYLTQARGIPGDHILLYGRSMGSAIAAELATRDTPPVLVLESGFTSAPDMATELFPFLPGRWVCRFRYPTLAYLESIRCPVLIAHSPHDEIIPFKHGRQLFEAARKPKQFVELNGGHNYGGLEENTSYQRALKAFLVRHLGQTGPEGDD